MQQSSQSPTVSSSMAQRVARLGCATAFGGLMVFEWFRWPNGSPLLGPVGLIWYNGLGFTSLALCAISLAMLSAFLFRPNTVTGLISLLGGLNWVFWGVMAKGIGC
jgi:hypothetical protein